MSNASTAGWSPYIVTPVWCTVSGGCIACGPNALRVVVGPRSARAARSDVCSLVATWKQCSASSGIKLPSVKPMGMSTGWSESFCVSTLDILESARHEKRLTGESAGSKSSVSAV